MSVPEKHVIAEGRSLRAALDSAADQLGVSPSLVEHKIDLAHFRSAAGTGVGAETVRIFAWAKDPQDLAPLLAAEEWMKGVLSAMERTATVRGDLRGQTVTLNVDAGEAARHLVGRGGLTLRALQYLLACSIEERFPGFEFRIDVARAEGDEPRRDDRGEHRGGDRGEPRGDYGGGERGGPRGDHGGGDRGAPRGDYGGGDRGAPRGDYGGGDRGAPRGDYRGGDRGGGGRRDERPRDDRPRRSDTDVEDLQRLARKIAERVLQTGEPETIRRDLNSFDRRIVHVEVATIEGVASRSVGEGHDRRIEVIPASMAEPSGE